MKDIKGHLADSKKCQKNYLEMTFSTFRSGPTGESGGMSHPRPPLLSPRSAGWHSGAVTVLQPKNAGCLLSYKCPAVE